MTDKSREEFDVWMQATHTFDDVISMPAAQLGLEAWQRQQRKIDELEQRNVELVRVIDNPDMPQNIKVVLPKCKWEHEHDDCDAWSTSCGNLFIINEGTPSDNDMKYCCYCGDEIAEVLYDCEREK